MSLRRLLLLLLVSAPLLDRAVAAQPARAAELTDPLARFSWLRELSGACWSGTYPDGSMKDTQCYETQFGRYVRGTAELVPLVDNAPRPGHKGDSVFAWDAANDRITYFFWSDAGAFGTAEALVDGDRIVFPTPARPGTSAPPSRTVWSRIDADSFRVVREKKEGEGWKPTLTVTYRRVRCTTDWPATTISASWRWA